MTAFIPESIQILGTDGGGLTVILCSMYVDTIADLPAPTAYTGYRLSMGCTARVIADNSRHRINSAGQWVDITENDGDYTLPPATSNSLGGIMVGSGLTIDSAGMLSGDFSALWDSIYQTEKHLTGVSPLSFMASGNGIEAAVIYGNGQQTGTPTPDNIIMPTFCGVRTAQLFDKNATDTDNGYIPNGYIRADGTENTNRDYRASEYIAVNANTAYNLYCAVALNAPSVCFYDSNKNFISGVPYSGRVTMPFTTPQDAVFLRLSYRAIDADAIMLNLGSTALPYEPYGYKIPITCAGQTTPVYLGQTQTVRKVKKLVLDGTESWSRSSSNGTLYTSTVTDYLRVKGVTCMCSHYTAQENTLGTDGVNSMKICFSYESRSLYIRDTSYTSEDAWKAYLADQYAAGTPVTVWYVLAEPETGIVNEPLCKIGDYADELHSTDAGISIQTVRGQNTLTIATTLQPSEISITYF